MKKIIQVTLGVICMLALTSGNLFAQENINKDYETHLAEIQKLIKWEKTEIDLGQVTADSKISATFKFTNLSDEPFIILKVATSCGCTVPSYSKEPVTTGKSGTVVLVYNPAGRAKGTFSKSAKVRTRHGDFNISIKGTVI